MAERSEGARAGAAPTAGDGRPAHERRRNPRLRELVDEMLASLRAATRRELWTDDERRRCEAELAEVMRLVRFEAVWKGPPPAAQPGGSGGANRRADDRSADAAADALASAAEGGTS